MPVGPANTTSILVSDGNTNTFTTMKGAFMMDPSGNTTLQPFNQIVCASIKGKFIQPAPAAMTIGINPVPPSTVQPITPTTVQPVQPIVPITQSPLYIDAGADSSTLYLNKNINLGLLDITGKTIFRGGVGCLGPLEITGALSLSQLPSIAGVPLVLPKKSQRIINSTFVSLVALKTTWTIVSPVNYVKITPTTTTSVIRISASFFFTCAVNTSFSFYNWLTGSPLITATTIVKDITNTTLGLASYPPSANIQVNLSGVFSPGALTECNVGIAVITGAATTLKCNVGKAGQYFYLLAEEII